MVEGKLDAECEAAAVTETAERDGGPRGCSHEDLTPQNWARLVPVGRRRTTKPAGRREGELPL